MKRLGKMMVALVVVAMPLLAHAAPDTLVVKGDDGKVKPGAATSWEAVDDTVTFVLAEGVDGAAAAKLLGERLFNATATFEGGKLTVKGVEPKALLEQLSTLSLSGEGADPLADLAGLGSVVAMEAPEGGGSIRASRPTSTARPQIIKTHPATERIAAEVVSVQRAAFPNVVLKLRVRANASTGPLKKVLRRGKVFAAPVLLVTDAAGVAYDDAHTQRNLGAYYLNRGDRVVVHAIKDDGKTLAIDYVARK